MNGVKPWRWQGPGPADRFPAVHHDQNSKGEAGSGGASDWGKQGPSQGMWCSEGASLCLVGDKSPLMTTGGKGCHLPSSTTVSTAVAWAARHGYTQSAGRAWERRGWRERESYDARPLELRS